jgi:hypothetical protein
MLYEEIGKTIPVREIIALIAILQCVLAPALVYEVDYFSIIEMEVDSSTYFSLVLPCMGIFDRIVLEKATIFAESIHNTNEQK